MRKRILSTLLALCMVLGLLPGAAIAASDDLTPPVVTGVYMNSPGGTVTVGDTLYFDISVEDESEIVDATLGFSPCSTSSQLPNTIYARFISYNDETDIATVRLEITDNVASGEWVLSYIHLEDYYGNATTDFDNISPESYSFTVVETSDDTAAPVIKQIEAVDDLSKPVTVGDALCFDISVEDESEIVRATLGFSPRSTSSQLPNSIYARFISYNGETGMATVRLEITDNVASGEWVLSYVHLEDYYGNVTMDFDNIDISRLCFTVATSDILPEAVSLPAAQEVRVRDAVTIRPTVTPSNSIPRWTWTSADTGVAEVYSSGNGVSCNVTGIAPGTTTITGTTQNGLTASCEVTVLDAPLPESGTVEASYHVNVGGYVDIAPVLTPADATTLYEVTSDNPHVAGVGTTAGHTGIRIEGNNAGTATITIRGSNNLLMTTTVKVGRDSDRQHEKTTRPGREATCTRPGYTESVICSACRYVFTESKEIPATGHRWVKGTCENCGAREPGNTPVGPTGPSTPDTPSTPSTPSVPSNPAPSAPTPAAPDRRETISAGNQSVPVTVADGVVRAAPTDSEVAEIIASSTTAGVVEIDIASVENASELSLPQNLVNAIADSSGVSSLSIAASSGRIEMSGNALNTLSDALTGSNDQVTFKIDTVDVSKIPSTQKYPITNVLNSAVFVELSAHIEHRDENNQIVSREQLHEFHGDITVSVPFTPSADMEGRQIIACYIADDGSVTYFPVRYGNGVATFITNHFSTFAVVESRAAAFTDVVISEWYMTSIEYALDQGLLRGTSTDKFSPAAPMTRAMLWTVLGRLDGADVSAASGVWYAGAQAWSVEKGISNGADPNGSITRQELVTMLWRYKGSPAAAADLAAFTDSAAVAGWAAGAMEWAVSAGIIQGSAGALNPAGTATRAEVAAILMRFCESAQ